MNLSPYQLAIREWCRTGTGSAVIDAKAGAGKTTTLVNVVAPELRGTALFLAFNKHIADELSDRLPRTMTCRTIHGAALAAVKRVHPGTQVVSSKGRDIVNSTLESMKAKGVDADGQRFQHGDLLEGPEAKDLATKAHQLYDLIRLTLTDPKDVNALRELALSQDVILSPEEAPLVSIALRDAARAAWRSAPNEIDFGDMLWLVALAPTRYAPHKYDWVLLDEAQDLNAAQLAVVKACLKPTGRLLAVGDPNQAIYAWAGADNASFAKIAEFCGGQTLPLNVCYRCPKSHIALAQDIVPTIEAAPNAKDGTVDKVHVDDLPGHARGGDLVICRTTAPLVSLCLRLVRTGKPAYLVGQNLAGTLMAAASAVVKFAKGKTQLTAQAVLDNLHVWHAAQVEALEAKGVPDSSPAWERLDDTADMLRHVCKALSPKADAGEMKAKFESLFEKQPNAVMLCVVHRAKGLEANRVYIHRENIMPLPRVKQPDLVIQEWNLRYVALTRAKQELYFIDEKEKATDEK